MTLFAPQGRWRVWTTHADASQLLRTWTSYEVSVPHSGVGGMKLVLPVDNPAADQLLDDPWAMLAYEVMDSQGVWSEPPNCRFLALKRTLNLPAGTCTLQGASLGWLTGKAVRWPAAEDVDGKKVFVNATAGHIAQWVYYWAVVRGALRDLFIDFDETTDSDGLPWAETFDVDYTVGVTWRQILDGLPGVVWRTDGTTLQLAQDVFADVPETAAVLYAGRDVTIDTVGSSLDDAAGEILVTGGTNSYGYATTAGLPRWGRWQKTLSASGSSHGGTLTAHATRELATSGAAHDTATVTLLPSARWRVFDTLFPGQQATIVIDDDTGGMAIWDESTWDGPAGWSHGPSWRRRISDRISEIVITDDGTTATASFTVGQDPGTATELITQTVLGLTGGRVLRRPLTGQG